jgi:hypothetical protein
VILEIISYIQRQYIGIGFVYPYRPSEMAARPVMVNRYVDPALLFSVLVMLWLANILLRHK